MSNLPAKYNILINLNIKGFIESYISVIDVDDIFGNYLNYYSCSQLFFGLDVYIQKNSVSFIATNKNYYNKIDEKTEFTSILMRDFLLFSANTLENFIKKIIWFFDKNSLYPNFNRSSVGDFMNDLQKNISSNKIALCLKFLHKRELDSYRDNSHALRRTRNNIMHDDYLLMPNTFMNFNCSEILEYFVQSMIYLQCIIKYVECENNITFQ